MAKQTRFLVTCQGQQHRIHIDTVMIDDPDHPKSGKQIPAPHLSFLDHCSCGHAEHPLETPHCHEVGCDGETWLEAQMVYIKLAETAEPSCGQWALEFSGAAPKRVEQSWWQPEPDKVPARG